MAKERWTGGAGRSARGRDPALGEVIDRELSLLRPDVRRDAGAVGALLHEDFREFGTSGRTWDRAQTIGMLAAETGDDPTEAEDVEAVRLGDDAVLVTYRARRPEQISLRSSVWVRGVADWQLLFHQGTVCSPIADPPS